MTEDSMLKGNRNPLLEKLTFPLRISSVNVTKSCKSNINAIAEKHVSSENMHSDSCSC